MRRKLRSTDLPNVTELAPYRAAVEAVEIYLLEIRMSRIYGSCAFCDGMGV